MTLSPRELSAFLAVVENGTLGLAARQIHITQPALSRLIRHLEARLKQPLFERHTTGMVPTAAGMALIPHARLLLFEMDQTIENLAAIRGMTRGTVRIGSVAAANRNIVSTALNQLLEANPGLKAEVTEGPDDRLITALLGGAVDLIIAAEGLRHDDISPINSMAVLETDFTLFSGPLHPLALRQEVSLDEAFAERWVMTPENSTPRNLLREVAAKLGRGPPTIAIETSAPDAIIRYVAQSQFLGWLPSSLIELYVNAGLLRSVPVKQLLIRRRLIAYKRARGILSPGMQKFVELLYRRCESLSK